MIFNRQQSRLFLLGVLITLVLIGLNLFSSNSSVNKSSSFSIFCIILTDPNHLKSGYPFTVLNTWASACTDYRFISVIPNNTGTRLLDKPLNLFQPTDWHGESYENLTRKVYLTMRDVYLESKDHYDWYLKADDDTFINMDNLNKFLSQRDPEHGATYGFDFNYWVKDGYPAGGAGYVLSKKAFRLLGQQLVQNFSFCPDYGIEDINVAECLRMLNVRPAHSRDHHGRPRFNNWSIKQHFLGPIPYALRRRSFYPPQIGVNCCSDSWISFHYMKGQQQVKLNSVLKRLNKLHQSPSFEQIARAFLLLDENL